MKNLLTSTCRVLLIVLIKLQPANAQYPYFNKLYNHTPTYSSLGSHVVFDSNKFLVTNEFKLYYPYREVAVLTILDSMGNVQLTKEIALPDSLRSTDFNIIYHNNFFYLAFDFWNVYDTSDHLDTRKYALIKMDKYLDTLWLKYYDRADLTDEYCASITLLHDGLLLSGCADNLGLSVWNSYHFMKVDYNGNQIWHKTYIELSDHADIKSAIELPDYSIIAVGERFNYYDCVAFKLNSNGNLLWKKVYDNGMTESFERIIPTHAGDGLIFSGYCNNNFDYTTESAPSPFIMKVNNDGVILWKKMISTQSGVAQSLYPLNNGNYITAYSTTSVGALYAEDTMHVCEFDDLGNLIIQKKLKSPKPDRRGLLFNIFPAPFGGFYMTGCGSLITIPWVTYIDRCYSQAPDSACVLSDVEYILQQETYVSPSRPTHSIQKPCCIGTSMMPSKTPRFKCIMAWV